METKKINNLYYRTEYAYDLNGNLSSITYPGGRKIAYTYNQLNKVISVTETYLGTTRTLASNITYLPFGDIASMTYDNGMITNRGYDSRMRLASLLTQNSQLQTLNSLTYTRDNTGNIAAITDTLNPSKTKTHTYDNLYRLTLATGQWGAITYAYDSVGNRTYETTNTGNTTYNYTLNTNKLTLTTGEKNLTFSYDNNGNTISENTRQFIYNQNQRLTQVTDTGNVLGEYIYNGKGQRADKLIPSQNKCTVFHYDQNGLLITESTRTGNIKAEYVYLNGSPLAKIESNNIYYYHDDHLGTPMLMTDSSGSIIWQGEYLPFGEPLSITGTITNNLRFPGQYYDAETGLHQNHFRDYKTEVGRYLTPDPSLTPMANHNIPCLLNQHLQNPQALNLFIYTANNSINFIDPLGLDRYNHCNGMPFFAQLACKKYVDWGCSGPKNIVCCQAEKDECLNINIDKCSNEEKIQECSLKYTKCISKTKGLD
ncbi:MAG: hypothetical protein A2W22_06230 [Candidatus Levybacteria bacterium RBG_16_35_11]|nr:MAG: hypothetical protein A2W22_06230 [Candidatus Levybacteria bacterium RBG_16_35_11]